MSARTYIFLIHPNGDPERAGITVGAGGYTSLAHSGAALSFGEGIVPRGDEPASHVIGGVLSDFDREPAQARVTDQDDAMPIHWNGRDADAGLTQGAESVGTGQAALEGFGDLRSHALAQSGERADQIGETARVDGDLGAGRPLSAEAQVDFSRALVDMRSQLYAVSHHHYRSIGTGRTADVARPARNRAPDAPGVADRWTYAVALMAAVALLIIGVGWVAMVRDLPPMPGARP